MYFVDVEHEQLDALKQGLEIFEKLGSDAPKLYLFGLAKADSNLSSLVKEAVAEEHDTENLSPDQIQVNAIALVIELSSDILYYLTGSGVKLTNEEFVYMGGNEGVQSGSFGYLHSQKPQVTIASFTNMAIAEDQYGADRFLQQYGKQAPAAPAQHPVERTQPAEIPAQAPKESGDKEAGAFAVMPKSVGTWFDPLLNAVDAKGRHGNEIYKDQGEEAFREWVRTLAKKIGVPKSVRDAVAKEVVDEVLLS